MSEHVGVLIQAQWFHVFVMLVWCLWFGSLVAFIGPLDPPRAVASVIPKVQSYIIMWWATVHFIDLELDVTTPFSEESDAFSVNTAPLLGLVECGVKTHERSQLICNFTSVDLENSSKHLEGFSTFNYISSHPSRPSSVFPNLCIMLKRWKNRSAFKRIWSYLLKPGPVIYKSLHSPCYRKGC